MQKHLPAQAVPPPNSEGPGPIKPHVLPPSTIAAAVSPHQNLQQPNAKVASPPLQTFTSTIGSFQTGVPGSVATQTQRPLPPPARSQSPTDASSPVEKKKKREKRKAPDELEPPDDQCIPFHSATPTTPPKVVRNDATNQTKDEKTGKIMAKVGGNVN
ncbi:hypothetical protein K458DRAFT_405186 [Lentithecium fluviatile CBS 122367]|uniref:Uncharacterized protein n=1 Tax=Lentithecium fluviatile CBS 122367 TaxID=1168545 RepID=A0A6G1IXP4_9PLEO|nr:hypothetical protein K458DRAFT_405186 [Lentithecium fluviatile CBS 122367]